MITGITIMTWVETLSKPRPGIPLGGDLKNDYDHRESGYVRTTGTPYYTIDSTRRLVSHLTTPKDRNVILR